MKSILEYLSTKIVQTKIKATDETIKQIVKDELDRLGHNADLNHIDVSEVTNMNALFSCDDDDLGSKYNDLNPNISGWDVSNVKRMEYMFYECEKFNCDISGWNVSSAKNMDGMFYKCKKFNCNIGGWDVSSVKNMQGMFDGCSKFNQDLSQWKVGNVEDKTFIFFECPIKEKYKPTFK